MSATLLLLLACAPSGASPSQPLATVPSPEPGQEVAVLAGGCFWCLESDLDKLTGVISTTSGFAGGKVENPTYQSHEGHIEAVHVIFDPEKLPYEQLLHSFWRYHDPTDGGGQFCDRGHAYKPAIFPQGAEQLKVATRSKEELERSGVLPGPVATLVLPDQKFWPAEVYHQDFHEKNPGRYVPYRRGCGRDARVADVWAQEREAAASGD